MTSDSLRPQQAAGGVASPAADSLHKHLRVYPDATHGVRSEWSRWLVLALVTLGIALFVAAYFFPWWHFTLYAPQYPHGLELVLSLNAVTGDVREINMLNHYIGMGHLDEAAVLERQFALYGVAALCAVLAALGLFAGRRLGKLIGVVGLAFPGLFLLDSFYWLHRFGHELNPRAPLRIPPFTPEMFGNGKIGQFMTFASPSLGFWFAVAGFAVLLGAVLLRRRVCASCSAGQTCGVICTYGFVLKNRPAAKTT